MNTIHHRVSNFCTQGSSNLLLFLYAFTPSTLLLTLQKASSTQKHEEMQLTRAPFGQLTNPLTDQIPFLSAEHLEDFFSLQFAAQKTIPQTSVGTFTTRSAAWDLYLLLPSPCHTSLSLKQGGLPRAIMNTAFQHINRSSEGVLLLRQLQSCAS